MWKRLASTRRRNAMPTPDEGARAATYPPPYPRGWYLLLDSEEVPPGAVRRVCCLGREFVAFRPESGGTAAVLDAHCPHQGANLGDGRVCGSALECAFHGWAFATDGRVVRVPYAERTPAHVRARTWPSCEHAGMIFSYCAPAAGSGDPVAPPYALPKEPAIEAGKLVYRGRYDAGVVRMHLLEFAENAADLRHFARLHGRMTAPWTRIPLPFVRIRHTPSWAPDPEQAHVSTFRDAVVLEMFGSALERIETHATITFLGPGGVVRFLFELPGGGEIVLYQTHTPVAPLAQRVRFRWWATRRMPRLLVSYVIGHWISQWRADVRIWEHKIYREYPRLVPEDGPVPALRRWYRQFYD